MSRDHGAEDLAEGLFALGLAVDRVRVGISRELDLTPQQMQMMCALAHGPASAGHLADLLGCDKTNITGLVDRLEPRGLVHRERSVTDRRVVRVSLTGEGRESVAQFRTRAGAIFAQGFDAWSQSRRRELSSTAQAALEVLGPDLLVTAESAEDS